MSVVLIYCHKCGRSSQHFRKEDGTYMCLLCGNKFVK